MFIDIGLTATAFDPNPLRRFSHSSILAALKVIVRWRELAKSRTSYINANRASQRFWLTNSSYRENPNIPYNTMYPRSNVSISISGKTANYLR